MSWIDLARAPDATPYWAFRGLQGIVPVAWGTRWLRGIPAPVEGRMSLPRSVMWGIPDAAQAPPERVSTTIELDNTDRSLDWLLIGGPSPVLEHTGPSALNLSGKLVLGFVRSGQVEELEITPTLCVVGRPTSKGAKVTLPLGSRDELSVGRTRRVITARQIKDAPPLGDGVRCRRNQAEQPFLEATWNEIRATMTENLDDVIPWVYGRAVVPLVSTYPEARRASVLLAWVSIPEPTISDYGQWAWYTDRYGEVSPYWEDRGEHFAIKMPVRVRLDDATTLDVWIVAVEIRKVKKADIADFLSADHFVIPPTENRTGMDAGAEACPPEIVRRLVTDHAEGGAAAIDTGTFATATASALSMAGTCGLVYRGDGPIAEEVAKASALGYGFWIGPDDRLRIRAHGSWTADDADEAIGELPSLRLSDLGKGAWTEWLPISPVERGAAATRTAITYSADQEAFWPAPMRRDRAPGLHRVELAQVVEATVSGDWIFPPSSDRALVGIGARRAFPGRRFQVVGDLWLASLAIGSLVRISHPLGMAEGGYVRRLARIERQEIMPAEKSVRLQLEDLGPLEGLRVGRLDSRAWWVAAAPSSGVSITLTASSTTVTASSAIFAASHVGASLQTWGAVRPELRRSWRIAAYISPTSVQLTEAPPSSEAIPSSPFGTALIDQRWIVMHNRRSKGWAYRPWAITAADEVSGTFSNGDPAFVMMP